MAIKEEVYVVCDNCGKRILQNKAKGWFAIFLARFEGITKYADMAEVSQVCSARCLRVRIDKLMKWAKVK